MPVPSPPTIQMPAAPYPASAAPYPASVVPYPTSVAPYGYAPPPAPKRSAWIIVLAILSGVLLLAGGGVSALFYLDHDKSTKASAEQQTQIEDLRDQLDDAQSDLENLQEDFDDLERDSRACSDAASTFVNTEPPAGATDEEIGRLLSGLILDIVQACGVTVS
jgi:hypothetical protein